jgi:hypothetical protein
MEAGSGAMLGTENSVSEELESMCLGALDETSAFLFCPPPWALDKVPLTLGLGLPSICKGMGSGAGEGLRMAGGATTGGGGIVEATVLVRIGVSDPVPNNEDGPVVNPSDDRLCKNTASSCLSLLSFRFANSSEVSIDFCICNKVA